MSTERKKEMKKILSILVLVVVFMLFFSALPASISAGPESGGSVDVYPGTAGCTTTIKLHAWNAEGTGVIVWVFKGTMEKLLDMDEPWPFLVYGTALEGDDIDPDELFDNNHEGCFIIEGDDWYKNIYLKLQAGNYLLLVIPLIEGDDMSTDERMIFKEFTVSGSCDEEVIIPWVRDVEMTCYQVWINETNNFEFVFWWEYANNNWVKIYDMSGNEVFSIDMPYGNANFVVDLPDGFYTVKTFHDGFETPIQEFIIGKP